MDENQRIYEKLSEHDLALGKVQEHQAMTDDLIKQQWDNIRDDLSESRKALKEDLNQLHEDTLTHIHNNNNAKIIAEQQKNIQELTRIQSTQTEQIASIQKTLEQFAKIQDRVNDHESRIVNIEEKLKERGDETKEKNKTKGAIIVAVIAAVGSIIATILSVVLK